MAVGSHVDLSIYNSLGEKVKILVAERQKAGYHEVIWDGLDDSGNMVASGLYFYRMNAGEHTETRKLLLLK